MCETEGVVTTSCQRLGYHNQSRCNTFKLKSLRFPSYPFHDTFFLTWDSNRPPPYRLPRRLYLPSNVSL